jgi:hypothetical protein
MVGSLSGILTGRTGGVVTISYTLGSGCYATTGLTINPTPTIITGPGAVCNGSNITLTDSTGGGSWSSGVTGIASTSGSGIVTGVSAGTAMISYVIGGCGATKTIVVNPLPASITGADSVCEADGTARVYDATAYGEWSSVFVTVDTGGVVTGYTTGIGVVTYTIGTGCYVTKNITVLPLPDEVTGADYVCLSGIITMSDGTGGGIWSDAGYDSYASVGSASGIVSGIATGSAVLTYALATGCVATKTIVVNPLPQAISGGTNVCVDASIALGDSTTGGVWLSGMTSVGSVGSLSGMVTGVAAGTVVISYAVTNLCGTAVVTKDIRVNPLPDAGTISGSEMVCVGSQVSLSSTEAGGIWSSGFVGLATVGSASGYVNGISPGLDTIRYTVTNSCGTAVAFQTVSVDPLPYAGAITGLDSVCPGDTVVLNDSVVGGAWSGSNGNVSLVTSLGQVVGVEGGVDTVVYSVTNSCGTATAILPFMVSGDCTNGVPFNRYTTATFSIYPNPNNGVFSMLFSSGVDEEVTVYVTNLLGEKVLQTNIRSNVVSEVVLNGAVGVYIITVSAGDGVWVEKVIISE